MGCLTVAGSSSYQKRREDTRREFVYLVIRLVEVDAVGRIGRCGNGASFFCKLQTFLNMVF